jgi:corrinoid protein of di/trimethylamine methyltransferase
MAHEEILKKVTELVVDGEDEAIRGETQKGLAAGLDPYALIGALNDGMQIVSQKYDERLVALPELILAGDAFHASVDMIKPILKKASAKAAGRFVIGTVQYDIHILGHELVKTMMEVEGFECWDLGGDVPPSVFVEKVKEVDANIVGLSALMTTTMPGQKDVIDALKEAGLRDKVIVMVGGAPVSQQWADKIGADGYAKDAVEAPKVAKKLLGLN